MLQLLQHGEFILRNIYVRRQLYFVRQDMDLMDTVVEVDTVADFVTKGTLAVNDR